MSTKIALFGAGKLGSRIAELLLKRRVKIDCFIDEDPDKNDQMLKGIKIHLPEHLLTLGNDVKIIISIKDIDPILSKLEDMGFIKGKNVFSHDEASVSVKFIDYKPTRDSKMNEINSEKNNIHQVLLISPLQLASDVSENDSEEPISAKMPKVGNNTGNMVFVEAMRKQLDLDFDACYAKGEHYRGFQFGNVHAVMPSANFIYHGFTSWHESVLTFLNNTNFPITFAGLGAQADSITDDPQSVMDKLAPISKEFLFAVAKRCVSLGVRGKFTAECLEAVGIHNYRVIGCPSMYMTFKDGRSTLPNPHDAKTVMHITPYNLSVYETKILELGYSIKSEWIMQTYDECDLKGLLINPKFPDLSVDKKDILDYHKEHSHVFFSYGKWDKFLKESNFTFSFGSRFHGNVMAINAGIPALWITHDSRTQEFMDVFSLPHIKMEEMANIFNINQLIERCDYSKFYKKYPEMLKEYKKYLDENNLSNMF